MRDDRTPLCWHEIVRPGAVLWLAAEGANEVDARIRAAAAARFDGEPPAALPFARQAFDVPRLTAPEAKAELIELARSFKAGLVERFPGVDLVMIVIDTLGSAAGFLDGNNSAEAQRVMDMLRQVNVETDALVLVVDHFGKVAETGVMGASAKAQSAEAVLAILADKEIDGTIRNRRMAVHKLRGGASGATIPFSLRQVAVGAFAGTTYVVEWSEATPVDSAPQKAVKPAWSGNARVLKNAVERALIEHGKPLWPFGDDGVEVKATSAETVRTEFYASYAAENAEAKRKAFNRLLDAALAKQLLGSRFTHGADHLWIVKDDLDSREERTGHRDSQRDTGTMPFRHFVPFVPGLAGLSRDICPVCPDCPAVEKERYSMDRAPLVWFVLVLAALGLGTGLKAARLWLQASKVPNVPLWATIAGLIEPADPAAAIGSEIAGLLKTGSEAAALNAAAAKWTAASVVLNGASAVLGAVLNFL